MRAKEASVSPTGWFHRDRGTKNDHDHQRHCREKLPHIPLFEFVCLLNRHTDRHAPGKATAMPARDPWQTRPKHASFLRPPRVRLCVFVRCVRSHAAGCSRGHSPFRGITAFAPVSRASASGIRLALPLAVAAIDLANLLREHLSLIECSVGRRLENGALAAAHVTGGRPVRAESATEREKQLPGASVSDRRDRFIRHPQVMAQATPCIRRKT